MEINGNKRKKGGEILKMINLLSTIFRNFKKWFFEGSDVLKYERYKGGML